MTLGESIKAIREIGKNPTNRISKMKKRIAELERKLEQTEKDLTDYQFNYPKIKDLEKENAELKEALAEQKQYNAFKCEDNKKTIWSINTNRFRKEKRLITDSWNYSKRRINKNGKNSTLQ